VKGVDLVESASVPGAVPLGQLQVQIVLADSGGYDDGGLHGVLPRVATCHPSYLDTGRK
jgi:hypothetical protein